MKALNQTILRVSMVAVSLHGSQLVTTGEDRGPKV